MGEQELKTNAAKLSVPNKLRRFIMRGDFETKLAKINSETY